MKGKPLFSERRKPESVDSDDYGFVPIESAYAITPSPSRRELTPRDADYNRNVRALFNHIVPGLPIDADPPETRRDAEPFAAVIEKTLKRLNITESPWLEELTQAWPKLVSPEVAKVARPGKWDNGILYVYVTTSVHLFELRRQHLKQIEQAVRDFAKDDRVKHVRLMVNAVSLP
jgi:hypothetical protein